jgi:hypothetical protein
MRELVGTFVVAAVTFSSGCGGNSNAPSGTLPVAVTVQVGQTITADGLSVTFIGVSSDSRCPSDANCVIAGDATLQFNLAANQRAAHYDLQVARADARRATHQGFTIEVQALEPYPSSGKTIRQDEYRALIGISR